MTRLVIACVAVVALTGCTAVQLDLQGASARAQAAQAAGLLSANDPLVPCLQYFAGAASNQAALTILKGPFAGLIDIGTDLYILDAMAGAGGVSDKLDAMCGGVAMKILKNAGRRAPGL